MKDDKLVATCHRRTDKEWFVCTNTKVRKWIFGDFRSLNDAFIAWLETRKKPCL
jgi:hypothetical protein